MKPQNPLDILFAGETVQVRFLDGKMATVHVRALPLRYLHQVIATYEHQHLFVELCTCTKARKGKAPEGLFAGVTVPTGYWPVPAGWSDNLSDESMQALYQKAEALNFQRAVNWARAQIAAKKMKAPLMEEVFNQLAPQMEALVERLLGKLNTSSISSASAPASSATPAAKS